MTGTVTNKTTGKPAAGDSVVLVEPMTGMTEVAHATVEASGHYTLNRPTNAPALVKVTHQGLSFLQTRRKVVLCRIFPYTTSLPRWTASLLKRTYWNSKSPTASCM